MTDTVDSHKPPASRPGGSPDDSGRIDPVAQRRSRLMLIGLFSLFGFPLLLATGWLHLVRTSDGDLGTTSRGELIAPAVPLTPFTLGSGDGEVFELDDVRGIWTLLYLPEGACEERCQRNLYHMRQVRLALNHRMDRVQRAVVLESAGQIDASLLAEHPGLTIATGEPGRYRGLLEQIEAAQAGMESQPESLYVIDPLGNLMLRFAPDLAPESMLKDLKHLLKVSRIG